MEVKDIRKLLDAISNSDVSEFSLETGEYKLTVRRAGNGVANGEAHASVQGPQQQASADGANAAPAAAAAATSEAPPAKPEEPASKLVDVPAPIVGTFYEAPSPDAQPYVKVGDRVERGNVLCIIEAMKLMNEIEAETAGTVKEILVRNEEPVEYGQVLFRIDPA